MDLRKRLGIVLKENFVNSEELKKRIFSEIYNYCMTSSSIPTESIKRAENLNYEIYFLSKFKIVNEICLDS